MILFPFLIFSLPGLSAIKRIFPHGDRIADPETAQSLKLAWDRIHNLEERLQREEKATILLGDGHNANEIKLAAATAAAAAALAIAQQPGGTPAGGPGGGGGGTPAPGPPAGDPGSQTNPIIAMSAVEADIAVSVRASRQFYGFGPNPPDDQYWIDHAKVVAQFSNGKWYQGWNRYWEIRADPANTGSANPNEGDNPAIHT